jgi:intergrase/recombinase
MAYILLGGTVLCKVLELLKRSTGSNIDRKTVTRYVVRHGLLAPRYMRKVSWMLMVKTMPREVARFIESKFRGLKVSEAGYELLSEADERYPKNYLNNAPKL